MYSALSLFTGAGGMDVGFKAAGFDVIGANEIDSHACATYKSNHLSTCLIEGDINECSQEFEMFRGVDVVFGGPPCQGFSVAGKMNPNDPRSKLIFSFASVVERLTPKAFVMENVRALGELTKFAAVRNELLSKFSSLGYNVFPTVLNAKDFGVPQSRERVFFVGTKKPLRALVNDDFMQFKRKAVSLGDAIRHLGPAGTSQNPRSCKAKITLAANPILRKSPYAGMLFNGQGRPLNPDAWSSTLPASMGGNRTPIIDEQHLYYNEESWVEQYHAHLLRGGKPYEIYNAPKRLRRLSVDEAIILQSFPVNYKFAGPQSKVFSQIGNAVPCDLAKAVASGLLCAFNNENSVGDSHQKSLFF